MTRPDAMPHFHSNRSEMFCGCCDSGQEVEELKEVSTLPILVPELRFTESRKAPSHGSFSVAIPMKGHISFGVKLDVTDTSVGPMIIDIESGAVASFNAQNPAQAIQIWDTIAELEDAKGMVAVYERMNGPLPEIVRMTLRRPRQLNAMLSKKDGPLGVLLDYKPSSVGGLIASVKESGLVSTWNKEHPEDALSPGDRILKINGKMPTGDAIIQEIKDAGDLNLTVLKFQQDSP
eukprot:s46_g22.t1